MRSIVNFFRSNAVLSMALLGAVISAFFVPPSTKYIGYIDFRVLALLFSLMIVVKGFQKAGVFTALTLRLVKTFRTVRRLAGAMIFACFFTSMWITNDVSLITFVPFAMAAFHQAGEEREVGKVVVLQTIAANLGSMCTPVGNPQNLYLFLVSGMGTGEFVRLLLPYTVISFVMLIAFLALFPTRPLVLKSDYLEEETGAKLSVRALSLLFLLCMFTVGNVVDYRLTLAVVVVIFFLRDRDLFRYVDYVLLMTFAAFFVFIGNMREIDVIYDMLTRYTAGNEFLVSLLASQVISNVPAAILLSGFTTDYAALMLGTDIGGLGTLIASMASLITYKLYTRYERSREFLLTFTWMNAAFLAVLLAAYYVAN